MWVRTEQGVSCSRTRTLEGTSRVLYVALVDADLTEPNDRLAMVLFDKRISFGLEDVPFLLSRVAPTVRYKPADFSEFLGARELEQLWVRRVLRKVVKSQAFECRAKMNTPSSPSSGGSAVSAVTAASVPRPEYTPAARRAPAVRVSVLVTWTCANAFECSSACVLRIVLK